MSEEELEPDDRHAQEPDAVDKRDGKRDSDGDQSYGLHLSEEEEEVAEEAAKAGSMGAPLISLESRVEGNQAPALQYPVVGFGASAERLQAFQEVLENLDPETSMTLVLVTQPAPDQKSLLSEIVERYTNMPVPSIENGQRPDANHLSVLLTNQALSIRDGHFPVEPPAANFRRRVAGLGLISMQERAR